MMSTLRASVRALVAGCFLLVWSCSFAVVRPFLPSHRVEAWRRGFLGGACRGLLRIASVRVVVEGPVPEGPGFLVTNHLGYLDILVLASQVDAVFVSRSDVQSWPLLGPLTRWSGTVFLERERRAELPRVVAQMQEWLERGTQVVFFPEGTSGSGETVLPFRSSLFEAATRTSAPVRCAALRYVTGSADPPAREVVSWWGDMDFAPHLWRLLGLRGIEANVSFVPGAIESRDRKQAALRAHHAVTESFGRMSNAKTTRA